VSDALDRLFRCLVANVASLDRTALYRPIPVPDIHERLVPYRTHRATLGLDTGEDYDFTILRLLAGEGGYAATFPDDVRQACETEIAAINPEVGVYRQFTDATVLLEPERIAAVLEAEPVEPAHVPEPEPPERAPAEPPATSTQAELPFLLEEQVEAPVRPVTRPRDLAAAAACPYCGDALPVGRTVLFCPHCGQDIGVVHCPTCGTELDVGWQYCITCGQRFTGLG
jgi:transcription elongation factor Elf1